MLGFLIFKDKLNEPFFDFFDVSLLGVYVLVSNNPSFSGSYFSFGDLLALLAAFFYAGYLLSVSKLSNRFNTFNLIFYSSLHIVFLSEFASFVNLIIRFLIQHLVG